jgi:hypothetical protein
MVTCAAPFTKLHLRPDTARSDLNQSHAGTRMPTEVLKGVESELRAYASRLEDGDESLIEEEAGVVSGAFAGESLRAELLRAISEGELGRLRGLPWGVGAAFRQGPGVPSTGTPGVIFACRTRDDHRYWRYVEQDGSLVIEESEMLRRINPGGAPAADATGVELEGAWAVAVESIVEEHNLLADPRADAERLGPAQRFALDLLRDPVVILPAGAAEAEEALSVERSSTVRQALSGIRARLAEGSISRDDAAVKIVEVVQSFGLRAVEPPPPAEPITSEDVGVVCWMAVLK